MQAELENSVYNRLGYLHVLSSFLYTSRHPCQAKPGKNLQRMKEIHGLDEGIRSISEFLSSAVDQHFLVDIFADFLCPRTMQLSSMLTYSQAGLYCPRGDFYIDPQRSVNRALITHGHSDHARGGARHYLACVQSEHILRRRLDRRIHLQTLDYGEQVNMNGVSVSFHPAGHILGSAQIRLEYHGDICVVSGDYALLPDLSCAPFEPVRCHMFVTEITFGLPVYVWPSPESVFQQIDSWWAQNARDGVTSVLYAYSLGKAQRLIAGVDSSIGPILTHESVENMNDAYRETGVSLPETCALTDVTDKSQFQQALVITPSSAKSEDWLPKCSAVSSAFASGWMQFRSNRRNAAIDRGFVMSDHADWKGLLTAVELSEAESVWATHGDGRVFTRYLQEKGVNAQMLG